MCQFDIGDVVAYAMFVMQRYPMFVKRRGIIVDFEGNRDWQLAIVEWRDGTLSRVNVHNLTKLGANAHFYTI